MAQGIPKPGEKYLHFKNRLYQIITVARHSETGEILVIYQALYGDYKAYARPLKMFLSEVDREKYPEVTQKYRFMLVEDKGKVDAKEIAFQEEQYMDSQTKESLTRTNESDREVPALLMDFFDAKTYEEKYRILIDMREVVTDTMINNMAVVLDLVIPEGELDARYEELKRCLRTQQKFETSRLH